MDHSEIKVEMADGGLLEPLVITEEGDVTEGVIETGAGSSSVVIEQSFSGESTLKKEEEHTGEGKNEDSIAANMCLEDQSLKKQQTSTEHGQTSEVVGSEEDKQEDDKPEETENMNDGQNRGDCENERQTQEVMGFNEKPEESGNTEDEKVTENDPEVEKESCYSSEQPNEGTKSQEEDPKKVC